MKKRILFLATILCTLFFNANAQSITGKHYQGFVDAGYTIGIGDYELGRIEVNTSHGYQISPYFYVGAGFGLHFMSSYETSGMDIPLDVRESNVDIPVFANLRCNLTKTKVAPFIDLKGGTYVNNNGGLYANLAVGCRFAINSTQAINVMIGYTAAKLEFETFDSFINSSSMNYTREARKCDTEGVALKVGFEF